VLFGPRAAGGKQRLCLLCRLPHLICVACVRCRQQPHFIPASTLGQIHRWSSILLPQLFRGAVNLGRPADSSLYHLGCFKLVLPDGRWWYMAAVVLNSLQQQQNSLDEMLEAFRQAGAVLQISVPKCKQCHRKRSKNGDQVIDWLPLRKHLLPPELSLLCPTRTLLHGCNVVGQGGSHCAPAHPAQGRQHGQGCTQAARAGRLPGPSASRGMEGAEQPRPRQLRTRPLPAAAEASRCSRGPQQQQRQ